MTFLTLSNLKDHLGQMIEKVEQMPIETNFIMVSFAKCVIGKTIFKGDPSWSRRQRDVLLEHFGIAADQEECLFSFFNDAKYTLEQWAVIRLFTEEIGEFLSRDEWLELARQQYESM